jgi:hypothetical protein
LLNSAFGELSIPGQNLALFYLRPQRASVPMHIWGGKRISERWHDGRRRLTFEIHGPTGLQDIIFISGAKDGINRVVVDGKPAEFFFDPAQGLAHGAVTFTTKPLKIEVFYPTGGANKLPQRTVVADALVLQWRERPNP